MSACAFALCGVLSIAPPAFYDHPAIGWKIDVVEMPLAELQKTCLGVRSISKNEMVLGCEADFAPHRYAKVFLPNDVDPITRWSALRHEIAHINGWPAEHPQ